MRDLWIVEKRQDGRLDFTTPQPETVFGPGAIHGMTDDQIAKVVFRHAGPEVILDGREIARWPTHVDPLFVARRKTW